MIDKSLFREFKFRPSGSLFELPLYLAKEGICPYCQRKLKQLRDRPLKVCGAKTCPCRIQTGKTFVTKI